jgi:hypothetical protein
MNDVMYIHKVVIFCYEEDKKKPVERKNVTTIGPFSAIR